MITTVFFDLDGTFADTAPDLAAALNQLLIEHGKPELSYEVIRPTVSLGGNAMIQLAFSIDEDSDDFRILRQRFLEIYNQRMHVSTTLFAGIAEVINYIESGNLLWGIITNKPAWLTEPLMEQLDMLNRAACIVCGDTTEHRKPHPAPMLHACKMTNSEPVHSIYVGDAERDIVAGHAAGMHTLLALYGYIGSSEVPEKWQADGLIQHPEEIVPWIKKLSSNQ